jgi:hypothetical protein
MEGEEKDPTFQLLEAEEEAPREKKLKGKVKVKEGKILWEMVDMEGVDRCPLCVGKRVPCTVDLVVIEWWEEELAEGKEFTKAPPGAGCTECRQKKQTCLLPQTAEPRALWVKAKGKGEKQKWEPQ